MSAPETQIPPADEQATVLAGRAAQPEGEPPRLPAKGRGVRSLRRLIRRRDGTRGAVIQFALTGLLAVVLVGAIGVQLLRDTATSEAIRNAKNVTRLAGEGVVAPNITPGVLAGRPASLRRLDQLVRGRILRDPVVRVKIWNAAGQVVYSDEPRLIGDRFPLPEDEVRALQTGGTQAEVSNLSRPENRFERSQGKLLEVYHGIRVAGGQRLLFESYLRFSSVAASGQRLWLRFAPAVIGGLLLLELAQIPLAVSLARRIRRGQREREALLQRAIDASEHERKRIARDLHDGVVQNLIGVSYQLAAAAEQTRGDPAEESGLVAVSQAASETRRSIRELRTLLVDIYPPDLHRAGLEAALRDLLAPLAGAHIEPTLVVPPHIQLPPHAEALLFRTAQEALRNVAKHSHATKVSVTVTVDDRMAKLAVEDDGRGFDQNQAPREEGRHFGLRILEDLTGDANGDLTITSAPGQGTRVRVEVPLP